MLYTFSKGNYGFVELNNHLNNMQAQDALLLWQDGVLLALKYPDLFQQTKATCYALQMDILARNLTEPFSSLNRIQQISINELVDLTDQHFPQLSL